MNRRRVGAALRVGDRVRYGDDEHVVTGLSGTTVRLLADSGAESVLAITRLQVAPDFAVLTGAAAPTLVALDRLDRASPEALTRARWWERHILEIETGHPDPTGPSNEPGAAGGRHAYDPAATTLEQRELAKVAELAAFGEAVSRRTLRRYRNAYARAGLWGLIDHRATRATSPVGRVDQRVVDAVRQAMAEETNRSTGTRGRLRRRAGALLAASTAEVALPPRTTFYRLVAALESGEHTFGAATTRRSLANRPVGPFGTVLAARPGELVQVDTTALDVMALLDDGIAARVELTILVDLATRTICSGLLRPHGTKAVDAALLLARAVVPEPMRPGWAPALAMSASRLPHAELTATDARMAHAAAKPVIVPETIVCDRGAVYVSETFQTACAWLGISLQPAHPRTPTDKGVVERTFSSINTLFCQYVAGYTGRDVAHRGRDVDGQACWSLRELQDLFDQWVLAGWQVRPHDGLRHPELPRTALSPNEMYAALVAAAGYLPLAMSGSDYLELLPVAWRQITAEGIRLGSLTYDCAALNPLRGQRSPHRARRGAWAIHHDPYDLGQVWIRADTGTDTIGPTTCDPPPGLGAAAGAAEGWIEVPWVHRGRVSVPFADFTLRHTRRILAERGEHDDQLAVADALEGVLTRAEAGPGPRPGAATRKGATTRRIAAKNRAASENQLSGQDPPVPAGAAPLERRVLSLVSGVDDDPPAVLDDEDVDTDDVFSTVVPFGIFDAHAEARRFW